MKLTLRAWNAPYECLQSEEDSLYNLDRYNKTRYSRRKNKEGLLELASREAHEKQEVYFARFSMMMTAPTVPLSLMWDTSDWIS